MRTKDETQFCQLRLDYALTPRGREKHLNFLEATLNNEYTLKYLISGADEPRGYLMQWVTRRLNGHQPMVT